MQDVFLYIYRKCRVYNPAKRTASSWIVQTIYYQALQRRMILTARQHQSTPEVENGGAEALPSASILTKNDHSAEIVFGKSKWREILKTLPEDQWDTLRLHCRRGYFLLYRLHHSNIHLSPLAGRGTYLELRAKNGVSRRAGYFLPANRTRTVRARLCPPEKAPKLGASMLLTTVSGFWRPRMFTPSIRTAHR